MVGGGGARHDRYSNPMKQYKQKYADIMTLENLLLAWEEFLRGKRKRKDVVAYQTHLMNNLFLLRYLLLHKTYVHGNYEAFNISDPKPRSIHKATVQDRLLHHVLYNALYTHFDSHFIYDSYSCRKNKGTHKAVLRFKQFARIVSKNHTQTCWVLKCDIRKFFASIDHDILLSILANHIEDKDLLWLLEQIITSFNTDGRQHVGLPLGNLTSQLLVNIYMNEFDHFVKHRLKAKHYIRYADDFAFLSTDKVYLEHLLPQLQQFLTEHLKLDLHPNKVFIKTVASGVDFLGWINFTDHQVLRTATKKRMFKRLQDSQKPETISSYKGMLSHGNAYKLLKRIAKSRL
jgi:RNA-directed DNA polymerase